MIYNCSWGPLPWPYVRYDFYILLAYNSEIFPTRTRSMGIAIGVSSQWYVVPAYF